MPIFVVGQKKGLHIDIQIKGWENNPVYFEYHYGKKNIIIDTLLLDKSGKAYIKSDSTLPGGIYMLVLPQKAFIEFIIDDKNRFFSILSDTTNLFKNLRFKNSEDNKAFLTYQKHTYNNWYKNQWYQKRIEENKENIDSINKINDEIEAFNNTQNNYRQKFIANHKHSFLSTIITALMEPIVPNPPIDTTLPKKQQEQIARQWKYMYYKNHYWDNIDFSDSRLLRTTLIENKINSFFTRVVPYNVDSIIAESEKLIEKSKTNPKVYRFVLNKLLSNFEMRGKWHNENVFVALANKYYLSGQAPWADTTFIQQLAFRIKLMTPTLIGKPIPITVFTPMDSTEKQFTIDTIPSKILLLYFWSSDCEHCQDYTLKLYELYQKYKNKGLQVVAITATTNFKEWQNYVREKKYTEWINAYYRGDYTQLLNLYDVYMTPRIFILNSNKIIIKKDIEVDSIEKIIKQYL